MKNISGLFCKSCQSAFAFLCVSVVNAFVFAFIRFLSPSSLLNAFIFAFAFPKVYPRESGDQSLKSIMTTAQKDYNELASAADFLQKKGFSGAKLALVLGTGLGGLAEQVKSPRIIDTADIPGYPSSSVEGHHGRILQGKLSGVECLVFQGRLHYYEGLSSVQACAPVIISQMLGAESIILTNASGSINGSFPPGSLMLAEDFICAFHKNPLLGLVPGNLRGNGLNLDYVIFPPYHLIAMESAGETGIILRSGTLGVTWGPSYETPAEVRMLQFAGADAASMSTGPEIIMAKHLGLNILALSCLTNLGSGISPTPLTHQEVQEAAAMVAESFRLLILRIIKRMGIYHEWH